MSFKNLSNNIKPREKALMIGVNNLNDMELLAIFLRTGTKNNDVLDVSKNVLKKFGNLKLIQKASYSDLKNITGIGKVKAIEIIALYELMNRIKIDNSYQFLDESKLDQMAIDEIASYDNEHFLIIITDNNNNLIYKEVMYKGTIKSVQIDPKDIISLVLRKNGTQFFCYHNHPLGNISISDEDRILTKRLLYYSDLFGVVFGFHKVINKEGNKNTI